MTFLSFYFLNIFIKIFQQIKVRQKALGIYQHHFIMWRHARINRVLENKQILCGCYYTQATRRAPGK